MNKAFKETRVKTGDVNATLENSIAGMKVTKSFCTEKEELEKFNESNQIFKKAREGAYKVMAQLLLWNVLTYRYIRINSFNCSRILYIYGIYNYR